MQNKHNEEKQSHYKSASSAMEIRRHDFRIDAKKVRRHTRAVHPTKSAAARGMCSV